MRAVLLFDGRPAAEWRALLLDTKVAGLRLFTRHALALKRAGFTTIALRVAPDQRELLESLRRAPRVTGLSIVLEGSAPDHESDIALVQRADTLIDPRLLAIAARRARDVQASLTFLDEPMGLALAAKSPHVVGVATDADVIRVDSSARPLREIGLWIERPPECGVLELRVGRHFWHIMRAGDDVADATAKVLLGTIKPTDGIFARTNRRVSIPISRLLAGTPVTPNVVTIVTLAFSILAGWLLSLGTYGWVVFGSFMAWFASMLDGVDGELARATFKETSLGHWLEMSCDYGFYLAIAIGFPFGFYRTSGDRLWLALSIGTVGAVFVAYAVNFWLKRRYARVGPASEYYVAYQRTLDKHSTNPYYYFARQCGFLITRGAFPYFIFAFSVLGLARMMVILIFIGSQLSWILPLYVSRLDIRADHDPASPVAVPTLQ